jgi:hypothetical protein
MVEHLCLKEDTNILCFVDGKETYLPIQTLKKDMLVVTSVGHKKIDLIGSVTAINAATNPAVTDRLYICKKGKYPELTEDLILTGSHSILVDTLTDEQKELSIKLINDIYITDNKYRLIASIDSRAEIYPVSGMVTVWNMSLEDVSDTKNYGIYANGLLVETASKRTMRVMLRV